MNFNDHSDLLGRHAFLSPSNYHWINYDQDKLILRYRSFRAAQHGTDLHRFAHDAIRLGINLPDDEKTLSMYVNDGIAFGMTVEQSLYYSPNCFGHADTLSFVELVLRISDLKTGIHGASQHQLEVYAALFCLEYILSPFEIDIELRIYQNDQIDFFDPYPETIEQIMNKIVMFDQTIEEMKLKGA